MAHVDVNLLLHSTTMCMYMCVYITDLFHYVFNNGVIFIYCAFSVDFAVVASYVSLFLFFSKCYFCCKQNE